MTRPVDPKVDGFSRYRMDFGYDGTDFSGLVKQPGLRTVQGELVQALEKIFGKSSSGFDMRFAGRTDAGVHAINQVAQLDLTAKQFARIAGSKDIAGRLNSLLPIDVRVSRFELAKPGFDARFSASFRRYRYRIQDAKSTLDPLQLRFVLEVPVVLSVASMNRAASVLVGLHDFAAFCKGRDGATTIRNLKKLKVSRNKEHGNLVEIELMADAFCHNMVRAIVGALVAVGSGKADQAEIERRLRSGSRQGSFKVVAAKGLSLIEVGYPKDSELAKQAEKARNMRVLESN